MQSLQPDISVNVVRNPELDAFHFAFSFLRLCPFQEQIRDQKSAEHEEGVNCYSGIVNEHEQKLIGQGQQQGWVACKFIY